QRDEAGGIALRPAYRPASGRRARAPAGARVALAGAPRRRRQEGHRRVVRARISDAPRRPDRDRSGRLRRRARALPRRERQARGRRSRAAVRGTDLHGPGHGRRDRCPGRARGRRGRDHRRAGWRAAERRRPRARAGHPQLRDRDLDQPARAAPLPPGRASRRNAHPRGRVPPFMRRSLAILFALAVACTPPTTAPSASPSASASASTTLTPVGSGTATLPDMTQALLNKPLPVADVFALTRAMRGRDGQPAKEFTPVRTTPPVEDVGTSKPFWTYDFAAKKNLRITATLRVMTEHAKWWVQDDITVDLTQLRQNATFFESNIYPTNRKLYGSEWSPGVDGDPRIDIMMARIPGAAAGYFSST